MSALGQKETKLSKEDNPAVTVMLALLHLQRLLITQGSCWEQLARYLLLSFFCMSCFGCVLRISIPGSGGIYLVGCLKGDPNQTQEVLVFVCPGTSSRSGSSYVTCQF